MSNSKTPAPDGAEPKKTGGRRRRPRRQPDGADQDLRRPNRPAIPSAEDCLRALTRLPGLAATGILTPPQVNAIRGVHGEILRYYRAEAKGPEKGLPDAKILEVMRKDPQLLSWLEPLLTTDQVAMVMKAAEEDEDG